MENALIGTISLVPSYLYWHYLKAARHVWQHVVNFSWFFWNFFSISLLLRTFFTPWWRERETAYFSVETFFSLDELGDYIGSKLLNLVVVIFGAIVRSVVIVLGLVVQALLWIGAVLFFLIWLVLPVLTFYSLFIGIVFILRPLPLSL